MSAAVRAIRLHFARHPATSPVLFHEKTTGKLRKDNGSCPIELPSVRGTSTSVEGKRRDGTRKFSEVRKSESCGRKICDREYIAMANYRSENYCGRKAAIIPIAIIITYIN